MLYSLQGHLRTGTRDVDHHVFTGAENTDSWRARKGDLQRTFPLDVPMVPSSMLIVASDCECLTCGSFSLGETIRFWSLEFIANCFGSLSLSPRRDGSEPPPWV
jgi:hypothetical protein